MILALTGISNAALAAAPMLEDILPQVLSKLNGCTLVAHNAAFDVPFLRAAVESAGYDLPCSDDALDTLTLARILLPSAPDHRLQTLVTELALETDTAHRALSDARATAQLLNRLYHIGLELPSATLEQLTQLASAFSSQTAGWFANIAQLRAIQYGSALPAGTKQIRGLVFSWLGDEEDAAMDTESMSISENLAEDAKRMLTAESPLRGKMPGFKERTGQVQMAEAVANALGGNQHLIVEAGTGTGKSMAYLVPAALYALANDARVIIATHTIALQEQIATRDFPLLREVIPAPLQLAVLKGRTHYICMRKLLVETSQASFAVHPDEAVAYMSLLVWLVTTPFGSKEELSLKGRASTVWPRVQSETESCVNKRCPFFKPCYYFRARGKAQEADLVVTNHSLVFTDLKAEHRVLPRYEKLIFDEAHHIEEGATKHLGEETHLHQCLALFGRLARDRDRQGVLPELRQALESGDGRIGDPTKIDDLMAGLDNLRVAVEGAFQALAELVPASELEFRLTADIEQSRVWQPFVGALDVMAERMEILEKGAVTLELLAEQQTDDDLANRFYDAAGFMPELARHLSILAASPEWDDNYVTWVELRRPNSGRLQIGLFRAPIDVAGLLQTRLFDVKESVVLTSATLSVNRSFNFVKAQLGLGAAEHDGRLNSLSVASPFTLAKQALLCVPTDVPDLARMQAQEAAVWLTDSLYQLAKASDGRILALFTSHAMLRACADALRQPLRDAGYQLFAQGIDGGRSQLLAAFRQSPKSVLLGAQSFWEGIDLPGDELRTLVIIRLPFAPPTHPVTKARHERLEQQGKSAFWHASLPEAVVRFRQGFGRLIRRTTDRGVVVVYDKRLIQSKYGATFIKSLEGVRPVVSEEAAMIDRIAAFFQDTPAT